MYIPKNPYYNPNYNPYKVSCEQQVCASIDAYVNCIGDILQGKNGCITIQLVDEYGRPIDLTEFVDSGTGDNRIYIEIIVTNSLGYYVGTWTYPPTNTKDFGSIEIETDGKISFVISGDDGEYLGQTRTSTGFLNAQISITFNDGSICNSKVVPCIVIANIIKDIASDITCLNTEDDRKIPMPVDTFSKYIKPVEYDPSIKYIDINSLSKIKFYGYYRIKGNDGKYKYYEYKEIAEDKDVWIEWDED